MEVDSPSHGNFYFDDLINWREDEVFDFVKKCYFKGYTLDETVSKTNRAYNYSHSSKINIFYESCGKAFLYDKDKTYLARYWANSLNTRYVFGYVFNTCGESGSLKVYDLFHGQTKCFPNISTNSIHETPYSYSNFCQLNMSRSLYFNSKNLNLLSLDVENGKCQVLDQKKYSFCTCDKFVINPLNNMKFLMFYFNEINTNEHQIFVSRGRIKDDKIKLRESQVINFPGGFDMASCYSNSILYKSRKLCFLHDNGIEDEKDLIGYHEINLSATNERDSFKFNFEFDDDFDTGNIWEKPFVWASKKICYVQLENRINEVWSIFEFNISTQKYASINFNIARISDISIDANGFLMLRDHNMAYRCSLKKPDSLENLTWFKIRKQSIRENNKLYEKAMKQLPLNSDLQPFSF